MNKEQLINAVKNATNGTFTPPSGIKTCLGWEQEYDELGRPLRGDPNTITGEIKIAGKYYGLKTTEFHCKIKDLDTNETLAEVDFTPDYIREYREKRRKDGER